jgi:hypothetical protein
MPVGEFKIEILEKQILVHHVRQGHRYRFPITSRASVGLRGVLVEPNPNAKRSARGYLLEAHKAARLAFE